GGEVRSEAGGAAASAQLGLFDLGCNRGGAGRGDLLAPAPGGGRGPTVPRATGRITEFLAKSGAGAVWQRARFGTVRPRVQIPGPRPFLPLPSAYGLPSAGILSSQIQTDAAF